MPAKAQRNDAAAVAKAAKAVSRPDVMALIRQCLGARLPKLPVRSLRDKLLEQAAQGGRPMDVFGRRAPPIGSVESGFGEDGELKVGSTAVPERKARRTVTRVDFATKQLVVTKTAFGRWPRYGTKRFAKAEVVRQRLKEYEDRGDVCKVRHLLGLPYDSGDAGKPGSITYHDLQVMEEKRLLTIQKTGD